jgi:hypothetical protein
VHVQGNGEECGHTRGLCRYHQLAIAVFLAAYVDVTIAVVFIVRAKALDKRANAARIRLALHALSLACEIIILVATVLTLSYSQRTDAWFLALSFLATMASFCANLVGTRKLLFHAKVAAEAMAARFSGRSPGRRLTFTSVRSAGMITFSHALTMQQDAATHTLVWSSTNSTNLREFCRHPAARQWNFTSARPVTAGRRRHTMCFRLQFRTAKRQGLAAATPNR